MIEDLANLTKILDEKVKPMVEAIKNADPSKEEYGILLSNFSLEYPKISKFFALFIISSFCF